MDINIPDLKRYYLRIQDKNVKDRCMENFNQQFHNVGHLNLQNINKKQYKRIINRFDGISLSCFNLDLWRIKKTTTQQTQLLKDIQFQLEKEQINGIYSNDNTSNELLKFLSFQNPCQNMNSTYNLYINEYEITNIHQYQRLISYVSNVRYFDKFKTPRQIFTYFAQIYGIKNSNQIAIEIIEIMGLQGCALTSLQNIKNGQYKRCQIGAELIRNPKCLCLEDPFKDLLYHEKLDLILTLKKLAKRGLTIVFTFSEYTLRFLKQLDKILILSQSCKFFEGNFMQLKKSVSTNNPQNNIQMNLLIRFMHRIDLQRFELINEQLYQEGYQFKLQNFKNHRLKILEIQKISDIKHKKKFFHFQNIKQNPQHLLDDVKKIKNTISLLLRILIMYKFQIKTFIRIGFFQFTTSIILLFSVLVVLNFYYKPIPNQAHVIAEQNLTGAGFMSLLFFYMMSALLNYKPLKNVYFQYSNYGFKNKFYQRGTFLIVVELLSFTQNFIIGSIFFYVMRAIIGVWFNVRATLIGQVILVIVTMIIPRDITLFLTFFFKKNVYYDFNIYLLLLNIVTIGYLVQIKSMNWVIKWMMFLFPLRNVYQGMLLNAATSSTTITPKCEIRNLEARSQFCSPLVYNDFYESTVKLNMIAFVSVFVFYKMIFLILFYILSRKKYIIKIEQQ